MTPDRYAAVRALLTQPEPVRWLFTGDSITHGALHTMGWRDYTELFTERVRWELERRRDVVIKTGISGWTIRRILDDIEWNILQFNPHVVSINVGMNDCNQGAAGLEAFKTDYLKAIEVIRHRTQAEILIHTPNWTLPTGGENRVRYLPSYVESIRAFAQTASVALVDHYTEWREAETTGVMRSWIGHGCHPNEYGHRIMAFTLFRALGIWDEKSLTCRLTVWR